MADDVSPIRGIRNNNPGNITYIVPASSSLVGCTGSDGHGYCVFDTAEHGIRGMVIVLDMYQIRHGLASVRELISRWAPPSVNNTPSYIVDVCTRTGFTADQRLNLGHGDTMRNLVQAIIWHECGVQPYPTALIWEAVDDALGFNATGER